MTDVMPRPWLVLDAPSNLGLRPPRPGAEPGVKGLAQALRDQGVVSRLQARDAGRLPVPAYNPDPDAGSGFRNGPALASFTRRLADRVGELIGCGDRLLVLGGDCSVLLGPALALRRAGRYGLVFVDGHDDYSPPRDTARYGVYSAAGQDLAVATGRGPDSLANLDGLRPYFQRRDVVHVGLVREPEDERDFAVELFGQSGIHTLASDFVKRTGGRKVAERALGQLAWPELAGFWVHVDLDVLDRTIMPAVDSPNPDGLDWDTLTDLLRELVNDQRFVGVNLGIYDPELDPQRLLAARIVEMLGCLC